MTKSDAEQVGPTKLTFNHNNVSYSFYYGDLGSYIYRSHECAINYVYSGEMTLDNGKERIHVRRSEYVFVLRDRHITMYKGTCSGEQYCDIFLMFTHRFLREMYSRLERRRVSINTPKLNPGVIKSPQAVEFASLSTSMTPYLNPEVKPKDDFTNLKIQESLLALLNVDEWFAPTPFDFNEPWKIDILGLISKDYVYEFTMEEMAHYAGRSLATFKRDFKKISNLTSEEWLIHKRLKMAYNKMKEGGKKVADVYAEVGFKSPSHFPVVFEKQYDISPTAIVAQGSYSCKSGQSYVGLLSSII